MNYRIVGPRLLLFLFVSLIGLLLVGLFLRSGPPAGGAELIASVFIGTILGLVLFMTIWSGLFGQSWIRSYMEAVGLTIFGLSLMFVAVAKETGGQVFSVLVLVPLYGVTLSLPLWCMRFFRGWRLLCEQPPSEHHRSVGIEDILLITTVIASAIMLSRSSFGTLSRNGGFEQSMWMGFMVASLISGLVSAPFSLLAARIGLTSAQPEVVFGKMVGFWILSWLALVFLIMVLSQGRVPGEAIGFTFIASMAAFGTLGLGLVSFSLDGNQLFCNKMSSNQIIEPRQLTLVTESSHTRPSIDLSDSANEKAAIKDDASAIAPPVPMESRLPAVSDSSNEVTVKISERVIDPFADEEDSAVRGKGSTLDSALWVDRSLAIGMLITSFLVAFSSYAIDKRQESATEVSVAARDKSHHALKAFGTFEQQDGTLYQFKAKPDSGDDLVQQLQAHTSLQALDLSGTKVSNKGAAQAAQFISLQHLDLSDTFITDDVFEAIPIDKKHLSSLNLSGTNITGKGLLSIATTVRCDKLILRGLKLAPEEIDQLCVMTNAILDLRGVKLTSMPKNVRRVVLGQNDLPAESICDLPDDLESLDIDSMKVTDEIFDRFIKSHLKLTAIGFSNTPLTGKSLASLSTLQTLERLTIGPGTGIIEEDLAEHQPSPFTLRINDKRFSGKFLNTINPKVHLLDLSHSGVDNSAVRQLSLSKNTNHFRLIGLAHTNVSHQAINDLAKVFVTRAIDIRGTQISASELTKTRVKFGLTLVIDPNQYSKTDRDRIGSTSRIKFELRSPSEDLSNFGDSLLP